jgi:hypothetical protein
VVNCSFLGSHPLFFGVINVEEIFDLGPQIRGHKLRNVSVLSPK